MRKLKKAINACDPAKIRAAIQAGDDVNGSDSKGNTPLLIAAKVADGPAIQALIEAGADIEAANKKGMTPLYQAIAFGNLDGANALIAAGADVEAGMPDGWTPLQKCAYDGFEEIIDLLLEKGADPNRVKDDMSPLGMACWAHNRDPEKYHRIVERLRNAGAEPDDSARDWAKKRGVEL